MNCIWLKRIMVACAAAAVVGCGGEEPKQRTRRRESSGEEKQIASAAPSTSSAPAAAPAGGAASGWGNIKGKIVWGGSAMPPAPDLSVEKDKEWCLKNGPLKDPALLVDADTKGVRNVFVFLRKPASIHPDYPKTTADVKAAFEKKFEAENKVKLAELRSAVEAKKVDLKTLKAPGSIIDQVHCLYVPHAVAAREGETILALNYEPISHNILVSSVAGSNGSNINMPPGTVNIYEWKAESQPLNIKCSIHGWMEMFGMVFDHPYFAVTGKDGSFELKNVPAGEVTVMMRDPKFIDPKSGKVGKEGSKGAAFTVKAGETLDLGEVKYTP